MKLSRAIALYARQLAANGCSGHTQQAYQRDLAALRRWIGRDPALSRIFPDLLAQFLTSDMVLSTADGAPRKAITVNRTKSALRAFFAFCVESGWIKDNPARLIRSTPCSPKEPTTLTDTEIERLRRSVSAQSQFTADRDRLILEILLGTGIRLGSLVSLNIEDVDLDQGILHIRTKGGGQDKVFLNPALQRRMARYLDDLRQQAPTKAHPSTPLGTGTALFRSKFGSRLGARTIQLRFAKLFKEAGITRPVSIHSLRHTFATRLYDKTGDLYLVQRALGHRNITTTEVYAKVSDKRLREAVSTSSSQSESRRVKSSTRSQII